jgi:hypothetical protein
VKATADAVLGGVAALLQGEHRTVEHVEHLMTRVEAARFAMLSKDWPAALKELEVVMTWREELRKMGKDWRRRDAPLAARVRSLEIISEAVFRQGEAFAALFRYTTAEHRMSEGLTHWEELLALEDSVVPLPAPTLQRPGRWRR